MCYFAIKTHNMQRNQNLHNQLARIENVFIEKARYSLSAREQKIVLFLVSNIDPRQDNFRIQTVPIKDLESILKKDGKKWGGLYVEMKKFARNISKKQITFPTDVVIDGHILEGYINWFSSVVPKRNKEGIECVSFAFAPELKPFLLKLNEFARIDRSEIANMSISSSIRLYQLFKSILQKQSKYKKIIKKVITVDELRAMFELEDKYPKFTEFRRNVLLPAHEEINTFTSLHIDVDYIRNSKRHIKAVEFTIAYKKDVPKQLSLLDGKNEKRDINKMSKSEILERRKRFNFVKFKKQYPKMYREKVQYVNDFYKDHDGKHINALIKQSIQTECETWFIENI